MSKKILSLVLVLAMCLTSVYLAFAYDDDDDVSIAEFLGMTGSETETAEEDKTAEPSREPIDRTKPIYEVDGSIVVTLSFTGDVTIGGNVQAKGKSPFDAELDKQKGDINFPFRNVKDIFAEDDLTVINFEGTLTTAGINPNKTGNEYLFRAPPEYVSMLNYGNIDAVSLENNHVMDMGAEGFAETKRVLTDAGIAYASEGDPAIVYARGVKIGLLAYQTFNGRHDDIIAMLPGDIAALRAEGCAIVVVNYHWGAELDYAPNPNQIRLGRATIDAGADLVIGHHSHRINPIEEYKGKYICYSLANFSFAGNRKPSDMSTFIFQVRIRVMDGQATSDAFRIIPCRISSRTDYNDYTPTPYTKGQNIESVLSTLKKHGAGLEHAVKEYPLKWPGQE